MGVLAARGSSRIPPKPVAHRARQCRSLPPQMKNAGEISIEIDIAPLAEMSGDNLLEHRKARGHGPMSALLLGDPGLVVPLIERRAVQ